MHTPSAFVLALKVLLISCAAACTGYLLAQHSPKTGEARLVQIEQETPEQPQALGVCSPIQAVEQDSGRLSTQTIPESGQDPILPQGPDARDEEIVKLKARIRYLEDCLLVPEGPVSRWKATLRPLEVPDGQTMRLMADLLADYPIVLQHEEGLWLVERIKHDDWKQWGGTIDEAIITYLGVKRLQAELTPEQFAKITQ
jgi:hypothetical protein